MWSKFCSLAMTLDILHGTSAYYQAGRKGLNLMQNSVKLKLCHLFFLILDELFQPLRRKIVSCMDYFTKVIVITLLENINFQ